MGLFTQSQIDQINKVAEKSKNLVESKKTSKNIQSMNQEIQEMSNKVVEYFKDSNSILITSPEDLHDYVTKAIESGYCGIDTETTGLDRQKDTIVGASLYYPGSFECYIPSKHIVPIFDEPYKNQLSYDIIGKEFQRFVDAGTKMIFANADFDLSMIYKDLGVDMVDICYYDVILAWRCLKEDERDNSLKGLYMKYVMKGKGDPMKFSDFFSPALFPYCRPEVAKLYAANDAKITYELFKWQLPYTLKEHPKCIKNNLQHIADLIWTVEFPMIKICQEMHRTGIFLDDKIANTLKQRYKDRREVEAKKLSNMVNDIIVDNNYIVAPFTKPPFVSGEDFNCNSPMHVKHLLYNIMNIPEGKKGKSTDKAVLNELNLPVTDQILKVRSLDTLINSFVKKLPQVKGVDRRVHAQFRQIGADTGRMSSAEPNLQNIPSHANDIRHMFRATPQKYHIKNCDDKGDLIHIKLPSYYDMKTSSGYRQVKDLHIDDDVILLKDSEEHTNKIVDIVNSEDTGNVDIFIQSVNQIMSGWKAPVRSPAYVMLSSDYSAQEPRLTAFVSGDAKMQDAFVKGRDVYASIASTAFNVPYEKCLEFHPKTGEYQPDGKARRNEAKTILLGITYGRSVVTIGDQLYGHDDSLSDEDKLKKAQKVYDSVLDSFPNLRSLMQNAQSMARRKGYVETILGRRRHIPDMQLPQFEFYANKNYVNPDIDPLDVNTLKGSSGLPDRVKKDLLSEFSKYKYFGQIARRTRELYDQGIEVKSNRNKIQDASRQCVNCVDFDTEILTVSGWKRYDEVSVGDRILSYSLDTECVVEDVINDIFVYEDEQDGVNFETPTFSSVSTWNHRWVVGNSKEKSKIKLTSNIYKNKWPDYPILRVADNSFEDNASISDSQLKVLGWIMTDGSFGRPHYSMHIYQSTKTKKNKYVYEDMLRTLNDIGQPFNDYSGDGIYHEIYLYDTKFTRWVYDTFVERFLTFEFVSTLSQRQSNILLSAMLQGDGTGVSGDGSFGERQRISFACNSKQKCDVFQYLCFRAGFATNAYVVDPKKHDYPSSHTLYESMRNIPQSSKIYYDVCVLKVKRAHIYPHHKKEVKLNGCWCISSASGTWVARRNGKVYITGNSIIQGSAADQTKMALLKLENSAEWKAIGGRLLIPVHDEIIAEVPIQYAKEGGELLSKLMCEAAEFLPFPSKCDVTTTLRWYGVEYPCKYERPEDLDNLSEDNIRWIQWHLYDLEYPLPVYKNEDGSKPIGDAALGINGVMSFELESHIRDYKNRYKLQTDTEFIQHIDNLVVLGSNDTYEEV